MSVKEELSEREMEAVTMVFRQYEKGLREAAINAKVMILMLDQVFLFQLFFREGGGNCE